MPWYAMVCYAVLCHAMPCHAVPSVAARSRPAGETGGVPSSLLEAVSELPLLARSLPARARTAVESRLALASATRLEAALASSLA